MWHTMPQGEQARWLAGVRELERALAAIGCVATLQHVGSTGARDRQLAEAILGQVDRARRAIAVQQGEIGVRDLAVVELTRGAGGHEAAHQLGYAGRWMLDRFW